MEIDNNFTLTLILKSHKVKIYSLILASVSDGISLQKYLSNSTILNELFAMVRFEEAKNPGIVNLP